MAEQSMNLKLLLPFEILVETSDVLRIVVENLEGAFGLLPRRLDCVSVLVPGILFYETATEGNCYLAIDEGVLIKTGSNVLISVRRAIQGTDLGQLHASVDEEFMALNERELGLRTLSAKLDVGILQRFKGFEDA